jgi:hypothetical protein
MSESKTLYGRGSVPAPFCVTNAIEAAPAYLAGLNPGSPLSAHSNQQQHSVRKKSASHTFLLSEDLHDCPCLGHPSRRTSRPGA